MAASPEQITIPPEDRCTPKEAATEVGVSLRTLYRLLESGEILAIDLSPGVGDNGHRPRYTVSRRTVRAFLAKRLQLARREIR